MAWPWPWPGQAWPGLARQSTVSYSTVELQRPLIKGARDNGARRDDVIQPSARAEIRMASSAITGSVVKRALVTGAAGTFGLHITAGLICGGCQTLAVVRSVERGAELQEKIAPFIRSAPVGASLSIVVCDLSSAPSISLAVASALGTKPLDILVNNAAAVPAGAARAEVESGIEAQWAVSVLGYHRVLRSALPALLASASPRVVFVASNYAGNLDLSDPEFKRRAYDAHTAYSQSKQADRMLARAWALREPRLTVYSCHPGIAESSVARNLGMSFSGSVRAAQAGAVTPLLCALGPEAAPSGSYYADGKPARCRFSEDTRAVEALWTLVESYDKP
jgi:NAD(P)-dependent dehydrogenase (short-subunit alcohol dehydrogenase family)